MSTSPSSHLTHLLEPLLFVRCGFLPGTYVSLEKLEQELFPPPYAEIPTMQLVARILLSYSADPIHIFVFEHLVGQPVWIINTYPVHVTCPHENKFVIMLVPHTEISVWCGMPISQKLGFA